MTAGPIGIFDSGVGGLTVVGELLKQFPDARVLYVADQSHVPYGGRPLDEIRSFACGISRFLADEGCSMILMACNISSAVALKSVRDSLAPIPVFGMIEAAARCAASESDRIGVLATQGTVISGAYSCEIRKFAPDAFVEEVACPKFVPIVESGDTESVAARAAAREYLAPLHAAGCDLVILGCTHYPYLLPVLKEAAGELWSRPICFIDPAVELIGSISVAIRGSQSGQCEHRFLTSGDPKAFESQIPRLLPNVAARASAINWRGNSLLD